MNHDEVSSAGGYQSGISTTRSPFNEVRLTVEDLERIEGWC